MNRFASGLPMKLVIGNWKMNGTRSDTELWWDQFTNGLESVSQSEAQLPFIGIAPPLTVLSRLVDRAAALTAQRLAIGAQDCSAQAMKGAFTGEVSAELLVDAGAEFVLLGHSERRRGAAAESNEQVATKLAAAEAAGLLAILCVGESLAEREAGQANRVIAQQITESLSPCQQKPAHCHCL